MKKLLILFLFLTHIACQTNSTDCCKSKEDLAENIIQVMKDNDIEKYKKLFLPFELNGIPIDKNEKFSIEDYNNGVIGSFVDSQNEFSENDINIKDFNIIDIENTEPNYQTEIFDSVYDHYKFNVILANKKNKYIKAEFKCVKIGDNFFFRDDVSIRK